MKSSTAQRDLAARVLQNMKVRNYETLEGAKACWIFEDQAAIILTSARQGAGHGADAQIKN